MPRDDLRAYRTAPYEDGAGAVAAAAEACCRRGVPEPERVVLAALGGCGAAAGCCACACSVCGAVCCACASWAAC